MKQKKAAKHLLVPAVVVFAIATVIECVQDTTLLTQFEYWQGKLYTFIIGSGTSVEYSGIPVAALESPGFSLHCLSEERFLTISI